MSSEVLHSDQADFFGFGRLNTYGIGDKIDYQSSTNVPGESAQALLREYLELGNTTYQDSSTPAMANESAEAAMLDQSQNGSEIKNIVDASPWSPESNEDPANVYDDNPQQTQALSDTTNEHHNTPEPSHGAATESPRENGEQRPASLNPVEIKRNEVFPTSTVYYPRRTTTPSQGDNPSDDDQIHSSAMTAESTSANNANHSVTVNSLLLHDPNSPLNARQALQQPAMRRVSNLRKEVTAGELAGPLYSRNQAQQITPILGRATAQSPQLNHVHPNTIGRGHSGVQSSHRPNGYDTAEAAHPAYLVRTQSYDGYPPAYQGYHDSVPSPTHSEPMYLQGQDTHYGHMNGGFKYAPNGVNVLSQPVIQHFQPYGQDLDMHRSMDQQGYGTFKQEESSPRSMGSVPSVREKGYDVNIAPDQRTLRDLETNPSFTDDRDLDRLARIFNAMMNMPSAQDNEGMKKTWMALSKDRLKVERVCKKVLNACYVSDNIRAPLQHSVKPQHHYETLDERVEAVCEAFKQQKTMCKHLMEAPYLYQVVDDPNLAAMRVINNRKVNKGKKEAIEQGRKALKEKAKSRGHGHTSYKNETEDDFQDDGLEDGDYEEDDDTYMDPQNLPQYRPVPGHNYNNPFNKRAREPLTRHMSSDDSTDPTYGVPPPKKTRKSGSMYQLNERNEMVDTSLTRKSDRSSQPIARRAIHNRRSGRTFQPPLASELNNSGTDFDSDNMGYCSTFGEEDYSRGRS